VINETLKVRPFSTLWMTGALLLQLAFMCAPATADTADTQNPDLGLMAKLGLEPFTPDQSMWSNKTRVKFEKLKSGSGEPLAVLTVDRLNIVAPVFVGTDSNTLDRGVGVIETGPMPGEVGNIALSAHRDSFFRPLKDIELGDEITLHTLDGELKFQVSEIKIVDALDISVLDATSTTVLTLITCYPFYYAGFAPDRYIVRALPVDTNATDVATNFTLTSTFADAGENLENVDIVQ
jgi:LPXTG-site transpeptidase (sortase) family protein